MDHVNILLIGGIEGRGARPGKVPVPLEEFVKKQAPGAKYVLTVCTGT